MPIDKKNEQLVIDRLEFMDDSIDNIEGLDKIQNDIFNRLKIDVVKALDVDSDGNIKRSRKNQLAVSKVGKIRSLIVNDGYKGIASKFITSFDTVKKMADKQIKEI